MKKSILIIGKPQSTKTRFLTQFTIRAEKGESSVKLIDHPDDLSSISEDRKRAYMGQKATRTTAGTRSKIELKVQIGGQEVDLTYPDSDGEQVNEIIKNRQVSSGWKDDVENSNYWVLFIRPNDLDTPFNTSMKSTDIKRNQGEVQEANTLMDRNFFIELIQILLFLKGIGHKKKVSTPRLVVALTCWDELKAKKGELPEDILKKVLPLFAQFIASIWDQNAISIYGLSPQGKELSDKSDDDFTDSLPENNGYIILPDGQKSEDITRLIADFFQ